VLAVASAHAMEGQDLDVLNEMSADGSGSNGAQAQNGAQNYTLYTFKHTCLIFPWGLRLFLQ